MTTPSKRFSRKPSTGMAPIHPSGSVLRTHSYARFMQRPTGTTLYDTNFGTLLSPRRTDSRILKNKTNRRRTLEVNRFSNLDQREQYRRLIEQCRTSNYKESSVLFGLTGPRPALQKNIVKNNDTIIDLTEKSPETAPAVKKTFFRENFRRLDNVTPHAGLPLPRKLTSMLHDKTPILSDPVRKFSAQKMAETPLSTTSTSFTKSDAYKKDFSEPDENEPKYSLISPYLSKNFFSDLMKTYGRRERQRRIEASTAELRAKQLREKREAKDKLLAEILHKKLQVQDVVEDDVPSLPELTPDMNDAINTAFQLFPPHDVLSERFNITITREHMSTLFGLNWLNDEIINFYMELIVQRSKERDDLPSVHAMNTFFYPRLSSQQYNSVRRWTKKVDIFAKDLVLYPIHLGVHWCLAVVDFMKKEIRYYDSMGGANRECLQTLKDYLRSEHKNKKNTDYDVSDWRLLSMSSIPQQMNGSDCGVFACKFAEYIANKSDLTFDQSDMPYFRRAMVWEILSQKLLR